MKILYINMTYTIGSTGKIVEELRAEAMNRGHSCYVVYARGVKNNEFLLPISSKLRQNVSIVQTRLFGRHGLNNSFETKKIINKIEEINPDLIHLHNIHGFFINYKLLFEYLKIKNKKVIWTLHDCWSVTGHCAYFDYINCQKWKNHCEQCPQLEYYPITYRDKSKHNFNSKKKSFTSLRNENLLLVTPSIWLKSIIEESFLNKYPIRVINNGVDIDLFKFRDIDKMKHKLNLQDKKIILSVMFGYNERKGVKDLNLLADKVDASYKIILVGIEKKDYEKINKKILIIPKTNNKKELSLLYNLADVFVNLTYEEVFGMTNIESLACGTPVVTYRSGGCVECIDENTGYIIEKNDITKCYEKIKSIVNNKKLYDANMCRNRVLQYFTKSKMISEYIKLYECYVETEVD